MKKLALLVPAIACVSQGTAAERFTVNAGDLVNDDYRMVIINTGQITTRILNYLHKPSNNAFETLSAKEKEVTKAWFRYRDAKEFNKYFKMEFDKTQADKIILKKVSRTQANNSNHPKEFYLIIPGKIDGKKVEPGNNAFSYLCFLQIQHGQQIEYTDDIFLNMKFKAAEDGTCVKVVNGIGLFVRALSVKSIDCSGMDTSSVTDMNGMFSGCENLTSLNLSNFDTSKVTDMSGMFSGCENLTSLDLSNFDTSKVTDMDWMFFSCKSLAFINFEKFNAQNVLNMSFMFVNCQNLSYLNLGDRKGKNTEGTDNRFHYDMFGGCINLLYPGMK